MNQKKAKDLRRAVRVAHLSESKRMINQNTQQIRLGVGARAAYQKLKRASLAVRTAFVVGLSASPAEKGA